MELNFSELDYSEVEKTNANPEKYWEQTEEKPQQKYKKKKVSFDDILSNMNLVVNKTGVLQFMASKQPLQQDEQQYQEYQEYQNPNDYNNTYNNTIEQVIKHPPNNNIPIDPSVKHSYIYNKYFKDYQTATNNEPVVRVPKTMEEYRQMLLEDKIKQIEQAKRINEIKSTKLMFTSNEDASLTRKNIQPTSNNLRKMNFW
jgi:hypothetical protein